MLPHVTLGVILVLASVTSAILALYILSILTPERHGSAGLAGNAGLDRSIFLFEDQDLIDATDSARNHLMTGPQVASDWDRMVAVLSPNFGGLKERLSALDISGRVEIIGRGARPLRLIAETVGSATRIELIDPDADGQAIVVDALSNRSLENEVALLRSVVATSPVLTWRYDETGSIDWANLAFLRRAADHLGLSENELTWPLPDLLAAGESGGVRRVRLLSPDPTRTQWYERRTIQTAQGLLHHAVGIDTAVRAESALREFVQTLTKTFAHLPIGLAIFDRQRQLALFNPALTDLTKITAEFLSGRPTLFAFLDALREARMIPEPKDYPTWRETMADLERDASSGHYEETWTLPTGQTYRIVGRPHPDGAVAFLLEDISAEISLARRFRSELQLGQDVLDRIPEAIAVFSAAGTVVQSNASYAELWGIDPATALGQVGIADSLRAWQAISIPSHIWTEVRDFIGGPNSRTELTHDITLTDGRRLSCRFVPMSGGLTLAGFQTAERPAASPRRVQRRLRRDDTAAVISA